jgi:hypothetical protein
VNAVLEPLVLGVFLRCGNIGKRVIETHYGGALEGHEDRERAFAAAIVEHPFPWGHKANESVIDLAVYCTADRKGGVKSLRKNFIVMMFVELFGLRELVVRGAACVGALRNLVCGANRVQSKLHL